MKDQAQINSFIGSFTWPSMLSPAMCRSQAMSVAVSLRDLPLLRTPLHLLCLPHQQVLPSRGGGNRGSPAGWDLDWPPARTALRVTFVGSKPWSPNMSPWVKQHRWCIWQQQQVLHREKGRRECGEAWGSLIFVPGTSSLPFHLLPVMAFQRMWHYHPDFKDGETCFHKDYVMLPRLHSL